jgi:hypothetical protein
MNMAATIFENTAFSSSLREGRGRVPANENMRPKNDNKMLPLMRIKKGVHVGG